MRAILLAAAVLPAFVPPAVPQKPQLQVDEALRRVGEYVAAYEDKAPALVATEEYIQRAASDTRRLKSEMLVVRAPHVGWVSFRDTFEVDGRAVADRQERLTRLFLAPQTEDALEQAKRIVLESSRFNLQARGLSVSRTINYPMLPLRFVRLQNQVRSRFRLDGGRRIDGVDTVALRFEEQMTPGLIASPDGALARGTFWVEPTGGAVVRAEVYLDSQLLGPPDPVWLNAVVRVRYREHPSIGFRVPESMDEELKIRPSSRRYRSSDIVGGASYANVRQFSVSVETEIR